MLETINEMEVDVARLVKGQQRSKLRSQNPLEYHHHLQLSMLPHVPLVSPTVGQYVILPKDASGAAVLTFGGATTNQDEMTQLR